MALIPAVIVGKAQPYAAGSFDAGIARRGQVGPLQAQVTQGQAQAPCMGYLWLQTCVAVLVDQDDFKVGQALCCQRGEQAVELAAAPDRGHDQREHGRGMVCAAHAGAPARKARRRRSR